MNREANGQRSVMNKYHQEMILSYWVSMFNDVYWRTANYGKPASQLLLRMYKNFSAGSHSMLRGRRIADTSKYIAKMFAWYCAIITAKQASIEDVIWSKYPGVCPRCLEQPCSCGDDPSDIQWAELRNLSMRNTHERPTSLRNWQAMFSRIYPLTTIDSMPECERELAVYRVYTRLVEEMGELTETIDQDSRVDPDVTAALNNELADVFAWLMALANHAQLLSGINQQFNVAECVWSHFPNTCYACKINPCQCVPGNYRLELAKYGAASPLHLDALTGVANRGALDRHLDEVDAACERGGDASAYGTIFFDLDDFKGVNTDFGYEGGDQILRETARVASKCVNDRGILFRRGGEEFLIVLDNKGLEESRRIAEEIRLAFEENMIKIDSTGKTARVTASFGVAAMSEGFNRPSETQIVAEHRGRQAKDAGKNCVVSSGGGE